MAKGEGKGHRLIDLTGKRFVNWLVLSRAGTSKSGHPLWLCQCQCGSGIERTVIGDSLRNGLSKGCGCIHRQVSAQQVRLRHPDPWSEKPEYKLYQSAKFRAKRDGLPFSLDWKQIHIPTHCPVLGIELKTGDGKPTDASPTLDKLIPELGYTDDNVRVISFRANSIKRDASAEELRRVLRYVENALQPILLAA
ncbi:MAG: hypothetical protein ABR924_19085 [Terracidiphilus sp.]|jgi:hypothetical protein